MARKSPYKKGPNGSQYRDMMDETDMAMDKKKGIKEDSKRDKKLDKKKGVKER